ncbi:CRISPR system CASCADE complex protein CasC [Actinomyces sp. Chiba101]|uniref:type I-E CRISPR-associated protein Cas7/Cse4/CasC n=1 Tax=Actinomyces TaxID=1654 RepID=UPI000974ED18|nr:MULTISPECIES: type I-E CRISPR-associated protein Cas7/Cse4/CasC [Actinomyces]BAW92699.1 CRISPR system CASCADE complex protein CasC [Actinomyces sp. Chiba101]GAV94336.1 CRISPR system CASCADE complex protein CasC [Actinomyces denticolens]SUU07559.1 CRISPR-associated protein Cas7/Cse4/CasC, subtype I-E/ECOLI [Actinomyces denticolens]
MSTFVDIHVIQSVPPSCVNRDDSGSPKSAVYGGVRRLRVSSQSWKRATRLHFIDHLDASELGTRTKRVVKVLADAITSQAPDLEDRATALAEDVFKAAKIKLTAPRGNKQGASQESGYLLFLSRSQVDRLADLAIAAERDGASLEAKEVKRIFKEEHAVDVSLFGRMVADDADLNVDAACQVAHAISTHAAENEYDFFTAVDDEKNRSEEEDAGAGMMGTVEFASATMYRYATVNIDMLKKNLGDGQAALRALEAFVSGFCLSMPTGKQNTFANRTLPETVVVTVREDQPVSLVGAFETAVPADASDGYLGRSVQALAQYASSIEDAYGMRPAASFVMSLIDSDAVISLGERVAFAELPARVSQVVASRVLDEEPA